MKLANQKYEATIKKEKILTEVIEGKCNFKKVHVIIVIMCIYIYIVCVCVCVCACVPNYIYFYLFIYTTLPWPPLFQSRLS